MQPRFQADADFNEDILFAVIGQELSVDFQTAGTARLAGLADLEILERAASEGRILVTHDQKTMPAHFARFVADKNSSGVLIVPQHLPLAVVVDELLLVWDASEAEEWINRIAYAVVIFARLVLRMPRFFAVVRRVPCKALPTNRLPQHSIE